MRYRAPCMPRPRTRRRGQRGLPDQAVSSACRRPVRFRKSPAPVVVLSAHPHIRTCPAADPGRIPLAPSSSQAPIRGSRMRSTRTSSPIAIRATMTTTAKSARVFSGRLIAGQFCTDAGNGLDDEGQARDCRTDLGFPLGVVTGIEQHYRLGNLYSPPVTWPDLRGGVSAKDRERPLVTDVNGPPMARRTVTMVGPRW